jgi:hypothetical protein
VTNYHGRYIERTEYDEHIEANRQRVQTNKEYYRQRQQIVEHPFGTIKRSWGYTYTLLKTKPKVSGEFALIFTCYNLKRVINIIGVKEMVRRLKGLADFLWALTSQILVQIEDAFFPGIKSLYSNFTKHREASRLSFCTVCRHAQA